MPCHTDGGDGPSKEWIMHRSELAEIFCELCKFLEQQPVVFTERALAWWTEHKKLDREKEQKEASLRKDKQDIEAAKKKLTARERRLLHIRN